MINIPNGGRVRSDLHENGLRNVLRCDLLRQDDVNGNQGISRLTSYYRYVSGDFRLSIEDRLICKFDTGGY